MVFEAPVADLEPSPPPPRHSKRWFWAALAVVVITIPTVIILTGGDDDSKSPLEVLTAASEQTTGAGTAQMTSVETITTGGIEMEIINISGATDFARKASALKMTSRGQSLAEIRTIGAVTYMSSPFTDLPKGADWVAITGDDLKTPVGESPLGSNDPSSGLKFLSAIKGNPKAVGHEDVDGVDTTHYTFTVDLKSFFAKVAQASDELGGSLGGGSFEQLAGIVDLSKLPAAAWIDEDGRVRKFVLTLNASEGGETVTVKSTMEFSHFDEPVSVSAPADFDTIPFSEYPTFFTELGSASGAALSS